MHFPTVLLVLFFVQYCLGIFEPYTINKEDKITTHIVDPPNIVKNVGSRDEKSYRFAQSIPTSISFQKNDFIVYTENTWRWIIKIQSREALSLSLIFDQWWIPEEGEVYVYNNQGVNFIITANHVHCIDF